jgi:hypothetical protein
VKPFVTDDQLAQHLRAVEAKLRAHGLQALADDVAELAWILEGG